MDLRRIFAVLVCVGSLVLTTHTASAKHQLSVVTDACPQFSTAEIERLLSLELDAVAAQTDWTAAPSVVVVCGFATVRILIGDRAGVRAASREIPAPSPGHPDAERVIALAASELVLAWLPEAVPQAPPPRPLPPAAPPPAPRSRPFSSVAVAGGMRLHDLTQPLWMSRTGLEGVFAVAPKVLLKTELGYQYGLARRTPGNVDVHALFGALGVVWRPIEWEHFHFATTFSIGGGVILFEPVSTSAQFLAASSQRPTISLGLGLRPGWRFGFFEVGFDVEGGGLLLRPTAFAADDAPVSLEGMFLGASLRVGVAW